MLAIHDSRFPTLPNDSTFLQTCISPLWSLRSAHPRGAKSLPQMLRWQELNVAWVFNPRQPPFHPSGWKGRVWGQVVTGNATRRVLRTILAFCATSKYLLPQANYHTLGFTLTVRLSLSSHLINCPNMTGFVLTCVWWWSTSTANQLLYNMKMFLIHISYIYYLTELNGNNLPSNASC